MRADFPLDYASITERIDSIDADHYARSRNFLNGAVTHLSPYLSRGVISTRQVLESVLRRTDYQKAFKLVQELCWRDYYQLVWKARGDAILKDLNHPQKQVEHHNMPSALILARCGIEAIDRAVNDLYENGYMHNHTRLYTAMLACNIGRAGWWTPGRWLYYHLLDHDVASNMLNWQWVAGTLNGKKYYANQENINKYCGTNQKGRYLDLPYEMIADADRPEVLKEMEEFQPLSTLPHSDPLPADAENIFVYNSYQLDPLWHKDEVGLRVLLLEPSHFERFPVHDRVIDFVVQLGKTNIPGLAIFAGEFSELRNRFPEATFYFKEHPIATHYVGEEESREWMAPSLTGDYPSFFNFWKKAEKQIRKQYRL